MGAWSLEPFGNDSALDWLGDLLAEPGPVDWRAQMEAVLDAFAEYERSRAAGKNKRVMTAEYAEYLVGLADPMPADMAETIRKSVGMPFDDLGDDETFRLIAAATVLWSLSTGDLSPIHEDLRVPRLQEARAGLDLRPRFVQALREVPRNTALARDYGAKWKKGVIGLADRLEAIGN